MAARQRQRSVDAHIPVSLRDPLLKMSAGIPFKGNQPTVFLGIVNEEYTEEVWDRHAERLAKLFRFDKSSIIRVKVESLQVKGDRVVDAEKLGLEIAQAIDDINDRDAKEISVVCLGRSGSLALDKAVVALLRGWKASSQERDVQFVSLGESSDHHYLNFCKGLCMKQLCRSIQFYNTMDYDISGYLDLDRQTNEDSSNYSLR